MDFRRAVGVVAVVCVAVLVSAALLHDESEDVWIEGNEGVVAIQSFDITDSNTGSSVVGSIFLLDSDGGVSAQIVATFSIADGDIGGVAFVCDGAFTLDGLVCSFQDDVDAGSLLVLDFYDRWRVSIGMLDWYAGAGTGSISITMSLDGEADAESGFTFIVSAGYTTLEDGSLYIGCENETYVLEVGS